MKQVSPSRQNMAKTENNRRFNNSVIHMLSKANSYFVITQIMLMAIMIIAYGIVFENMQWYKNVPFYFFGILCFSFIEYLMHRYLYHIKANTPKKVKFQYLMHGYHHDNPRDKSALAMPPLIVILYAFIAFILLYPLLHNLIYSFLPGMMTGYAAYLYIHFAIHAYKPPKNFLKHLWIHHSIHHYQQPERAFGVSSPLWDIVFNTMPKKKTSK